MYNLKVNKWNKKGFFFTADVIIGAMIFIVGAILITSLFSSNEENTDMLNIMGSDVLKSLDTIKIYELYGEDPFITQYVDSGNITNLNNSLLIQLGEFWSDNNLYLARAFASNITQRIIPSQYGVTILMDSEIVFDKPLNRKIDSLVVSKKIVSGLSKYVPVHGYASKIRLDTIKSKRTSIIKYFGGFVGQGNITTMVDDLPINASLVSMTLELDTGARFNLTVNGIQCNGTVNGTFYPNTGNMESTKWNISHCMNNITPGIRNNFTLTFWDELKDAYVGGGYLKIKYDTDNIWGVVEFDRQKRWLTGIDGVINMYSSFDVPGNITNMTIFLHYNVNTVLTNNTFYLTLANQTVLELENLTGEGNITLRNSNLTPLLDYRNLDLKTIPIRIGYRNMSFLFIYEGNADVAVITDVSGSMRWRMDVDSVNGDRRNCDDAQLGDQSTERLSIAKCLDMDFSADIINITGNKIALVSFSSSTTGTLPLTLDQESVNNTIGISVPQSGYTTGGGTCICCGVNSAMNLIVAGINITPILNNRSEWNYTANYLFETPPIDDNNNSWFAYEYENESDWDNGTAVLGSTNGFLYTPFVDTELPSNLTIENEYYADLWENKTDLAGAPCDFTSGELNSTANTFGISGNHDGWDWDPEDNSGPFGYDDNIAYNMVNGGMIEFSTNVAGANICNNRDCSGAYGISINITNKLYTAILNGGVATVSFYYEWDGNDNPFESSDEVWIKSYWESPTTGIHYLGSEMSAVNGDSTFEIAFTTNPDTEFSGDFQQDITSWIEGEGIYYLTLGGKLYASVGNEWGTFMFDNVQVEVKEYDPTLTYANLWEHQSDMTGPPTDFSSGTLNTTGNTYTISGADDGWDWDAVDGTGPFDDDDNFDYNGIVNGRLQLDNDIGGNNICSNYDCSGAYGILVNITPEIWAMIDNNASAILSFYYEWDELSGGNFEVADQVWTKARWTSPTSGEHILGSQLDSGHLGSDASYEIATSDDPDSEYSGFYSQDLSMWIEGEGMYYLELGGKVFGTEPQESGIWNFDSIYLAISNRTNHYYFRKNFNITDLSQVRRGLIKIASDDRVKAYLNGNLIVEEYSGHVASYWNVVKSIPGIYFNKGKNVIAVELINANRAGKFDFELSGLNDSREKAMVVMTDGVANGVCAEQNTGDASQDAILASCQAHQDYGITVYAVGYSDASDEGILQSISECGGGIFTKSSNLTQLQIFYDNVAASIISANRHSQSVELGGSMSNSILYPDSYIDVSYDPVVIPPLLGEIPILFEQSNFKNCSFSVNISEQIRIADAKLTSYSSNHWTDTLVVNGVDVFNLSDYKVNYTALGDPYILNIPPVYLVGGENNFTIQTGDSPTNETGCSFNNTLFYTGLIEAYSSSESVSNTAEGCNWSIEFLDGISDEVLIPSTYNGTNKCYFTSINVSFNINDTYDITTFDLLSNLDFDDDNISDINFNNNDEIFIDSFLFGNVPSMWGPTSVEIRVSQ